MRPDDKELLRISEMLQEWIRSNSPYHGATLETDPIVEIELRELRIHVEFVFRDFSRSQ